MSLPIRVDAYSGHKANELARYFTVDEDLYEIAAVLDQWYEPTATYFKVQSIEGKMYLLRYDEDTDEWTLQSGFDGNELLARPSIQLAFRPCGFRIRKHFGVYEDLFEAAQSRLASLHQPIRELRGRLRHECDLDVGRLLAQNPQRL